MHEMTAYLITTDRIFADDALASLERQGLVHPVEVVRNVRPLQAAHLPTLECETPYCVVVDDDVILKDRVLGPLLDEFRSLRAATPAGYKLNARVYCEAKESHGKGGLKMFYTPHLQKIGWPDEPHVSVAQQRVAESMGFVSLRSDLEVGVQKMGTDLDVYKKYLWLEIRRQQGQGKVQDASKLMKRARKTGQREWWLAALGVLDARQLEHQDGSKDEMLVGDTAERVDLGRATDQELCDLAESHREAADSK